jgi:Fic family protein
VAAHTYWPTYLSQISYILKQKCSFIYAESNAYIHTLIKAITLHFTIGYEHPFRDGNGRGTRGLY